MNRESLLYERMDGEIKCKTCAHYCRIAEGKKGICRTRENKDGILFTLIYNSVSSMAADPIEKKPLYHFHPGTDVFSIATVSCNFRCKHCQNRSISFASPSNGITREIPPEGLIELTKRHGCSGIAWTYNEPIIWLEYAYEGAKLAKSEGLYTVFVTNGFFSQEALELIFPYLDAANVDVKSFNPDFYRRVCGAELGPVLSACERMKKGGKHLEVTYLIIPTLNDSSDEIKKFSKWVAGSLGRDTPVHFSRFFPFPWTDVKYETPIETLEGAYRIAKDCGIEYVYIGNVYAHKYESTFCPECDELLIKRVGYNIKRRMKGNRCGCGKKINIVG